MQDENEKKLVFCIEDDLHARFRLALAYDRLTQSKFIKYIIAGYLTNNPNIRTYIDEVLEEHLSKKKKNSRKKDRVEEAKTIKNFALNKEEIENIFDLIESENDDI